MLKLIENPGPHRRPRLALWGGVECTVNRVGDQYFSQLERNGHDQRPGDVERFAALGISAIRYPVLWERVMSSASGEADWRWTDDQLPALRSAGITVIAGLVHHGSGPRHTSLIDPHFAAGLAAYAGTVAARYPWIEYYTPVNEPLTTARFSGLYGLWYPHGRDDRTFIQALLNQCKATVLAMRAIRAVNPAAKLVQTDDLGKTYGTAPLASVVDFYNERRWLAWDLLCGRVVPGHALWDYLTSCGISADEVRWFSDNPCPPDIIGANYYVTSERWLDHRTERYPGHPVGVLNGMPCVDIETARVMATPTQGLSTLLTELWQRYGLPIAVTEAHIDASRENQLRWLVEIWQAGEQARRDGVDLRAITAWALLGAFDWNSLVTRRQDYYESGAYDVRSPEPRPTALAGLMRELASGAVPSHPALQGLGWWRRDGRLLGAAMQQAAPATPLHGPGTPPILISGASGTLGRAFARICAERHLSCRLLTRSEMDIADPASVTRALQKFRPWALINASGYVRVDQAENDVERCFRENTHGPAILAAACAREGVHLTTFSSDLVFDGLQSTPYTESDTIAPLNVYGRSKAASESSVLEHHPDALVVRTSSFFGPWDEYNFVFQALATLRQDQAFFAPEDITVSPTYLPDLVNVCLDLIIDGERGIWHLTNNHPLTWLELADAAADHAGVDRRRLHARRAADCNYAAPRPAYSALCSSRAILLPSLDSALHRFALARQ